VCFHWIGQHDGHVLLAVLLVIVGMWVFVAIADEVREGDTLSFDEWAVRALRRRDDPARPVGPDWLAGSGP
jgi:undecaprenyl-diphosphatase